MSAKTFDWGASPDPYTMLGKDSITSGDHSPANPPSSEGLRLELGPGALQVLSGAGKLVSGAVQFGTEVLDSARNIFQSSSRN